jgi:16S rRNA (guanine527-N7)-methyltransferase
VPEPDGDAAAAQALDAGARALGLSLPGGAAECLLRYLVLLRHWNRAYNLTAIEEPMEQVRRHLLDALSLCPYIRGPRVLDVGSGAGVPGIVLAIARPALQVTLLDPALKRTRFLTQAVHELSLHNARVLRGRLQDLPPGPAYEDVVSRATMAVDDLVRGAWPLLASGGRVVAMLGQHDGELARRLGGTCSVVQSAVKVPHLQAARHVAVIETLSAQGPPE